MWSLLLACASPYADTAADTDAATDTDSDTDADADSDTDADTDTDTDADADTAGLTEVSLGGCVGGYGAIGALLSTWSRPLVELDGAPVRIVAGRGYVAVIGGTTAAVYDVHGDATSDGNVAPRWSTTLAGAAVDLAVESTTDRLVTIAAGNHVQSWAMADGSAGPAYDAPTAPDLTAVATQGGGATVGGGDTLGQWALDAGAWATTPAPMDSVRRLAWTGYLYVGGTDAGVPTVAVYSPYVPDAPLATWQEGGAPFGDLLAQDDHVAVIAGDPDDVGVVHLAILGPSDLAVDRDLQLVGFGVGQLGGAAGSDAFFVVDGTNLSAFGWEHTDTAATAGLHGGVSVAVDPADRFLFTVATNGELRRWGCWE